MISGPGLDQSDFPQQLPGPAQPGAWPGAEPQQVVSPAPGKCPWLGPDAVDEAEISFFSFRLWQDSHSGLSLVPAISTSDT
jgi:hypothetical protein